MKRVLIVKEGQWGGLKEEDYLPLIDLYRRILEKVAKVQLVATVVEAEKEIKRASPNQRIDAVVFVSKGLEVEAERLAKAYPKTRMVVFTGLIPEGKVIWVDKGCCTDSKMIENIVLDS